MKKILFVATITGHINSFHITYLKWFKEHGYEVHVASKGQEKIEYCDKHFELPFERFPIKKNNIKTYKELKKIINQNQYDIIHCHTPVGGVLTRLAARKARKNGTRVIYTAHGFHFYKGAPILNWLLYYPIEKFLSKYTDCIITINEEDYKRAKLKFNNCNIKLINGVGVDSEKFSQKMTLEEKVELKKDLKLNDNDFVLIQVGELNNNKNQKMAINTLKQINDDNIHLLIVGRGNNENIYRQMIKKYNMEDRIHMLGYRNDVDKLLQISNVALSLSYREGLPVNVIEANMVGIPVIATNCRGSRDIIINGTNGYIINLDDCQKLKEKILKLYEEKISIPKKCCERYELNNVIKEYEKLYYNIIYNKFERKKC